MTVSYSPTRVFSKSLTSSFLAEDYPGDALPSSLENLTAADRACLGHDGREAWLRLSDAQRITLLERSRREAAQREARAAARAERERLCGEYVEALSCAIAAKGADKLAANAKLDTARAAWYAVKGKRRR